VQLLGAGDTKVLLDLGGLGIRDLKTETGDDQRTGAGDAEFQNVATSDRLQWLTSQ